MLYNTCHFSFIIHNIKICASLMSGALLLCFTEEERKKYSLETAFNYSLNLMPTLISNNSN